MQALKTFKIIAEAAARNRIGSVSHYFDDIAMEMYPNNSHRREWARSNLVLFYGNEKERMLIMQRLTSEKTSRSELKFRNLVAMASRFI